MQIQKWTIRSMSVYKWVMCTTDNVTKHRCFDNNVHNCIIRVHYLLSSIAYKAYIIRKTFKDFQGHYSFMRTWGLLGNLQMLVNPVTGILLGLASISFWSGSDHWLYRVITLDQNQDWSRSWSWQCCQFSDFSNFPWWFMLSQVTKLFLFCNWFAINWFVVSFSTGD